MSKPDLIEKMSKLLNPQYPWPADHEASNVGVRLLAEAAIWLVIEEAVLVCVRLRPPSMTLDTDEAENIILGRAARQIRALLPEEKES